MSSDTPSPSSLPVKAKRVLACVLCQQRKVKCDRKFPCANCIKSRAQCVPATLSQRRRKRRFPERELLDRLRKYEDLLRKNNVPFDPLHPDSTGVKENIDAKSDYDSDARESENGAPASVSSNAVKSERRTVWHAMSRGFRDPENESDSSCDDVREATVKLAWDQTVPKDDNLLFGTRDTTVQISTLQPEPVQIFKLWQIYLDNVDPLLKVTHTPTLQARIIEAASNLASVDSTLEALMFGIYCMSVSSLDAEDCQTMFNSSREDLLTRYQFGCQQALYNCSFLRSSDRECLTALYFYLVSVQPNTVPQSLHSMLGVAIRIALRMGIQSESILSEHSVIEAEMRRRLWWSIVLLDQRVSELSNSSFTALDPTWDCKITLNVNDSELRSDMKEPPTMQGISTEAIFAVVRSEIGDYIRHTATHLEYTNPALKPLAKYGQNNSAAEIGEAEQLERIVEKRYLKYCNEENPLHYMTIWITRTYIAKRRLVEHHLKYSTSPMMSHTEAQRDTATSLAIRLLECDTKTMTSPITKGFRWIHRLYFPFPAYLQVCQDLRMRPTTDHASRAWKVLSDNYDAWFQHRDIRLGPIFQMFSKLVLQAWEACETVFKQSGVAQTPPKIVTCIRDVFSPSERLHTRNDKAEYSSSNMDTGLDAPPVSMPAYHSTQNLLYTDVLQDSFAGMRPETYSGMTNQGPLFGQLDQFDWTSFFGRPNWPAF